MKCGLLGETLRHSYSPQIHSNFGNYTYSLFEIAHNELEHFLSEGDFTGLNVTIPYKKEVVRYCAVLTDTAQQLGAVNTIIRRGDGTLIGHNTDYFGFRAMVEHSGLDPANKKVLVLGSGGASNTAVAVLRALNAHPVVISRSGENNYRNLSKHADAAIIVNTTPVGMYPNVGVSPVDLSLFPTLEGVLDGVYNPACTQLILDAQERGLITENGLWMLVAQAKVSAECFTGKHIPDEMIGMICDKLSHQMENIILIGMPGSGKTTVGKLLAESLHRKFVDADDQIVQKAGMGIPEIFEKSGEAGFRKLETHVLSELGKESSLVIATGGGCVTKIENYPLLHQNGRIIWIERNINQLPTEGRPLSVAGDLLQMYHVRAPMYKHFADRIVYNNAAPFDTVLNILKEK